MNDHVTEVLELFEAGYNCTQAVLSVFSNEMGIPKETALKISAPFGGGIAGYGNFCGALTGAIMVIGLKYGNSSATDYERKKKSTEKTSELIDSFEKQYGSCNCCDLIGMDIKKINPSEWKTKILNIESPCPKFLETVIIFLEEEL